MNTKKNRGRGNGRNKNGGQKDRQQHQVPSVHFRIDPVKRSIKQVSTGGRDKRSIEMGRPLQIGQSRFARTTVEFLEEGGVLIMRRNSQRDWMIHERGYFCANRVYIGPDRDMEKIVNGEDVEERNLETSHFYVNPEENIIKILEDGGDQIKDVKIGEILEVESGDTERGDIMVASVFKRHQGKLSFSRVVIEDFQVFKYGHFFCSERRMGRDLDLEKCLEEKNDRKIFDQVLQKKASKKPTEESKPEAETKESKPEAETKEEKPEPKAKPKAKAKAAAKKKAS